MKIQQDRDEALQHATQDGSFTPFAFVNDKDIYLVDVYRNENGNVYGLGALSN